MSARSCPHILLTATLLGAAFLLAPAPAYPQDHVTGSRSASLVEKSHRIELRLDRGHAQLVVRRTLFNGGPRHDQAIFDIFVPMGAVATGLASLGMKDGQPFWFRGDLMEAEAAAAKYMELTGIGGYYPKDPALLSWRSQTHLKLQVFPCAPAQPKTIEYTLQMPTSYREGRYHVVLPRLGVEGVPAQLAPVPARPHDRLYVDNHLIAPGETFLLTKDETDIALAPLASHALDGALASVPLEQNHALLQFHLEAPQKLSDLPRHARVVVVVDASRSIPEHRGALGMAAAKAYLSHLKGSFVQLLTFDRNVTARYGRFVPADQAIADLDKVVLDRKNGSRFDDALAQADALLAKTPPGSPRRILAITDLLTRSSLTPERMNALVNKSGALVHVGLVEDGDPQLVRDDDHTWADAVRATGGLVWNASASTRLEDSASMKRVYEEWARPVRIEKLRVNVPGIDPDELGFDEQLVEGEGIEHLRIHDAVVSNVELTGELWATPVRKTLTPDDAHAKLWSALVFGSDLLHGLSEPQMMVLAMRGGAVSPVTSYLAIEPGVRPSTEGLDWGTGESGGGRGEGIGLGSIGTIGHGGGYAERPDFLKTALNAAFKRCPPGPKQATVSLQTTRDEVVHVTAIEFQAQGNTQVATCLENATWDLDLPSYFSDSWASYDVALNRE